MATSQSGAGAGGKIVTNRRRQRLSATPYERPPLRSPNWFSAVVVPSARAIASGAGKIFASIFSESSSSEEEDYASGAPSFALSIFCAFTPLLFSAAFVSVVRSISFFPYCFAFLLSYCSMCANACADFVLHIASEGILVCSKAELL